LEAGDFGLFKVQPGIRLERLRKNAKNSNADGPPLVHILVGVHPEQRAKQFHCTNGVPLKKQEHLRDLGVDEIILLKLVLKK
jgi:hypothetical protein